MWVDRLRFLKKKYSLRSCYHKLPNRKKLILPLEKYFKTLNDMFVGTPDAKPYSHLQFFKVGEIMVSNISIWCYQGHFQRVTPDIDSKDEDIFQCYVPLVKILLYMLVIYKWSQINFDMKPYGCLIYCISMQFCVCIVSVS